ALPTVPTLRANVGIPRVLASLRAVLRGSYIDGIRGRGSAGACGTPREDLPGGNMNKTELVETIAQRTDIGKKDVLAVLDTFEDIAGEVVAKGKETLTIPGFLKFEQTKRAARTGRNPQT